MRVRLEPHSSSICKCLFLLELMILSDSKQNTDSSVDAKHLIFDLILVKFAINFHFETDLTNKAPYVRCVHDSLTRRQMKTLIFSEFVVACHGQMLMKTRDMHKFRGISTRKDGTLSTFFRHHLHWTVWKSYKY